MAIIHHRRPGSAAGPVEAIVFRAARHHEPAYEGLTRAHVVKGMLEERGRPKEPGVRALVKASMARMKGNGSGMWSYTRRHSMEVGCFSYLMAKEALQFTGGRTANASLSLAGGLVHDVGKTFLPMALMVKERGIDIGPFRFFEGEPMTDVERRVLRDEHLSAGTRYARLFEGDGEVRFVLDVIGLHHVMYNGRDSLVPSYPAHLKGMELPLHSRIAKTADFLSAVLPRQYRTTNWVLSLRQALAYAITVAGTELDPFTLQCFLTATHDVEPEKARGMILRLAHPEGQAGVSEARKVREHVCRVEADRGFLEVTARAAVEKILHYENAVAMEGRRYGIHGLGAVLREALNIHVATSVS